MKINDLKKELKMLIETEERLMRFLMQHPEHCKEAVEKIFEVCSLIVSMQRIIKEMKKNPKTDD
jgi:hypothetical protein